MQVCIVCSKLFPRDFTILRLRVPTYVYRLQRTRRDFLVVFPPRPSTFLSLIITTHTHTAFVIFWDNHKSSWKRKRCLKQRRWLERTDEFLYQLTVETILNANSIRIIIIIIIMYNNYYNYYYIIIKISRCDHVTAELVLFL